MSSLHSAGASAINRILSIAFGAIGVGIILYTIYFSMRMRTTESGFFVDEPNRVLKDLVPQRDYDIVFHIHNRSRRTLRIVGMGIT